MQLVMLCVARRILSNAISFLTDPEIYGTAESCYEYRVSSKLQLFMML